MVNSTTKRLFEGGHSFDMDTKILIEFIRFIYDQTHQQEGEDDEYIPTDHELASLVGLLDPKTVYADLRSFSQAASSALNEMSDQPQVEAMINEITRHIPEDELNEVTAFGVIHLAFGLVIICYQ